MVLTLLCWVAGVLTPSCAAPAVRGVQGAVAPMFPYVEPPPPADDYGAQVDLVALFGVAAHDDGGGGSDSDGAVADDVALHAAVDLPMMDVQSSKVVRECAPTLRSRCLCLVLRRAT